MGFDKPDAVGGDAIDPQDADVESGGMAVEADFNLVIVVLVQGDSLLWFFAFLSIVGGFGGLKNVSQARANLMKPGDLSKSWYIYIYIIENHYIKDGVHQAAFDTPRLPCRDKLFLDFHGFEGWFLPFYEFDMVFLHLRRNALKDVQPFVPSVAIDLGLWTGTGGYDLSCDVEDAPSL